MNPQPQWQPPTPAPSRTPVIVAAAAGFIVVLVAVVVVLVMVSSEGDENELPPAAPPAAASKPTPQGYDEATLATCSAAAAQIGVDDIGLDRDGKVDVIKMAAQSSVPELQAIAARRPTDLLDVRAAFREIADWCDDHDVNWPR